MATKLASTLQAVRGMNDILPSYSFAWGKLEATLRQLAHGYGYREIRCPLLEPTALFKRTVGEGTDIVSKEMYSFDDYSGDSLSLRPEGTASCVRAGLQHGLLRQQQAVQRLWYCGPMFRHERPQKGRYRQFYQFGVEVFGIKDPFIDAELMLMSAQLWQRLGIRQKVSLQLNSLGSAESRRQHRAALITYFTEHQTQLDADAKAKLQTNPLRILDSKNPALQTLIKQAPKPLDYLDADSLAHFNALRGVLDSAKLNYEINPHLVRGLDYYGLTVFEWVSDDLGAQSTVCAGGRYDNLVEQLGGNPTPATGFAIGLERLMLLLGEDYMADNTDVLPHLYLIAVGESAWSHGLVLAEKLRTQLPQLRLISHCSERSFKQQFKQADKSGARWALIMGEDERAKNEIGLKYLREDKPQCSLSVEALIDLLKKETVNYATF